MSRLMVFLSLFGLVYLGFANFRSLATCLGVVDRFLDSFYVRQEMKRISGSIELDYVANHSLPDPASFSAYVRQSMTRNVETKRDVANDWWGTAYVFRADDRQYRIGSAGPDRKFNTRDDIWVRRNFHQIPGLDRTATDRRASPGKQTGSKR